MTAEGASCGSFAVTAIKSTNDRIYILPDRDGAAATSKTYTLQDLHASRKPHLSSGLFADHLPCPRSPTPAAPSHPPPPVLPSESILAAAFPPTYLHPTNPKPSASTIPPAHQISRASPAGHLGIRELCVPSGTCLRRRPQGNSNGGDACRTLCP